MSVRRASDSLKSSIARKLCIKHPQRVATHQLVNKGPTVDAYYCEKCSIMLASQGYNVIKLNAINPVAYNTVKRNSAGHKSQRASLNKKHHSIISNRKNEIASFVEGLDCLHFQLQRKNEHIQDYLIKSENEHGQMIEDANKFYQELEQLIELQKYTTYNSILSKRALEEAEVRQARNSVLEALQQIQAMINDVRENMDAVESVDFAIYNTIMGGYQSKIDKVKYLTKESIQFKSQQKCFLVLPQIPKQFYTISDKISISFQHKSNTTTNQNSINVGFKPQRIVTEQDICISQPSQNSNQNIDYANRQNLPTSKHLDEPAMKMRQVLRAHGNMKELAFSFDQNANCSKQLRINEDENFLGASKYQMFKGFQEGKLSKIEQRLNSKQVCESRQSLGEYLDISQSRQRHNSLEDHQTLLIA